MINKNKDLFEQIEELNQELETQHRKYVTVEDNLFNIKSENQSMQQQLHQNQFLLKEMEGQIFNVSDQLVQKQQIIKELETEMGLDQKTKQTIGGNSTFDRRNFVKDSTSEEFTQIASADLQILRTKIAEYEKKNEELDNMINEEGDKLDIEIRKSNNLLSENKLLKENQMQCEFELNERENEILERDRYIDQLEA